MLLLTFLQPSSNAFFASFAGPSTVLPSSSGPQLELYKSICCGLRLRDEASTASVTSPSSIRTPWTHRIMPLDNSLTQKNFCIFNNSIPSTIYWQCIVSSSWQNYCWYYNFVFDWVIMLIMFPKTLKGGSKQFPVVRFWWVIITTLYHLMLQSWYQKSVKSSVNKFILFSWH